jgi:MerR family transcriptional regulator, light-induced transcriptional regulator
MDHFSIADLARYSGIKPHTIRIWEKRYHALRPRRSTGNTRYYDTAQLKRLLNITGLLDSEFKVSELCMMTDKELMALNSRFLAAAEPAPTEYFVSQLVSAAITYNETQFANIFSHCLLRYGMKDSYLDVLFPALVRVGMMWLGDAIPVASEHFISNLIRQKLFTAIDSLPPPKTEGTSWILFLPENEFHDIGLLLAAYLIRLSGHKVIYLGGNLPESSLKDAVQMLKPDFLLLFLVHRDLKAGLQKYIDHLNKISTPKKIYVAADLALTQALKPGNKIRFLSSATELQQQLEI